MAIEMVNVRGFTSCSEYIPAALNTRDARTSKFYTYGQDVRIGNAGTYYVNTDTLKIFRRSDNSRYIRATDLNGNQIGGDWLCNTSSFKFAGFAFAIDRNLQRGTIFGCYENNSGLYLYQWDALAFGSLSTSYNTKAIYDSIIGAIQPQVNWQSVSSITGNNKTYNLSKILTINDGEPVSNAAASSVNLNNDSRLDNLMSNA